MNYGIFIFLLFVLIIVLFGWTGLLTVSILYLTAVNLMLLLELKSRMNCVPNLAIEDIITSDDIISPNNTSEMIEVENDKPSIGNGEIIQFGSGYSKSNDRYALNYGDNKFYTLNKVRALRAYENQSNQARSIRATAKSIYSHELDNNEDRIWWERDVLEDTGNAELDSYFK
jgi:hypothetical protein